MQSGQQKMTCHENECHDKITQNLQKQIYQQKHQTQYGSRIDLEQSWTINKTEKIRIQAFENECVKKCFRYAIWISYPKKIISDDRSGLHIKKRKLNFSGHINIKLEDITVKM